MSFEFDTGTVDAAVADQKANSGGGGTFDNSKQIAAEAYKVETVGAQKPTGKVGVVRGFIDLGMSPVNDYQELYLSDGSEDAGKQATNLGDSPQTDVEVEGVMCKLWNPETKCGVFVGNYFDNGDKFFNVEIFFRQRPPVASFALQIEFPSIMLDMGQFYGDENAEPRPLRMTMGRDRIASVEIDGKKVKRKVIDKPFTFRNSLIKKGGQKFYGYPMLSPLHKMAADRDLLNSDGIFTMDQAQKLMGHTFLFQIQLVLNPGKGANAGKKYLNEKITFLSGLNEYTESFREEVDYSKCYGINFNKANNPQTVRELNQLIINTMKRASNFKGSVIEKELEEVKAEKKAEWEAKREAQDNAHVREPKKQVVPKAAKADINNDDLPY